jgi:hypothetical protein
MGQAFLEEIMDIFSTEYFKTTGHPPGIFCGICRWWMKADGVALIEGEIVGDCYLRPKLQIKDQCNFCAGFVHHSTGQTANEILNLAGEIEGGEIENSLECCLRFLEEHEHEINNVTTGEWNRAPITAVEETIKGILKKSRR